MSLEIPKQSDYQDSTAEARELLRAVSPDISTSAGSSVYEFIVRPLCILYAAIRGKLEDTYRTYSLNNLSMSNNTEKGYADDILSNYFISRQSGETAKAVITVYSSAEVSRIPADTIFTVGDISVRVPYTLYGVSNTSAVPVTATDVTVVTAYRINDAYCFNITAETLENTTAIVAPGAPVYPATNIPGFIRAELVSPIEGGTLGETDAEMVNRAKDTICSWRGGSATIHKILTQAGFPIYSSSSFSGTDKEMTRVKGSDIFIGTSGMVDTYIKTSKYPLSNSIDITTNGSNTIDITNQVPKGVLSIDSITNSSGMPIKFKVTWGSSDADVSPEGARFSCLQTVLLTLYSSDRDLIVKYTYMPYIEEFQDYMNRSDVKLVGSDIMIKAAIPAKVRIRGSISVNNSDNTAIRECIKTFINNHPVGDHTIDYSDIHQYVSINTNGSYLASPVYMEYVSVDYSGNWTSTEASTTGLLTGTESGGITPRMRFFCTADEEVIIE